MLVDPPEATTHALADLRRAKGWEEKEEARKALRARPRYLLQHPATDTLPRERQMKELRLLQEALRT